MNPEQLQAQMQQQLLTHFNNDTERTIKFIEDCNALGLDLGSPDVIVSIASKTPVFLNLLTHELWGTLPAFARVVKELNNFDNVPGLEK